MISLTQQKTNVSFEYLPQEALTKRSALLLFGLFILGWLPVIFGKDIVQQVSAMYPLAESNNPYFVPQQIWSLYIWTPVVVLSACLLFLSPGLFLSLAFNSAGSVGHWVLNGFALSLLVISISTAILQSIIGTSIRGDAFIAVVIGCSVICFVFLLIRVSKGINIISPLSRAYTRTTILIMVIAPMMLLIALTPKFFWENLIFYSNNHFASDTLQSEI